MFLYSDQWQVMVVKQFSSGVYQEIGCQDTFNVIPGYDLKLRLNNVTDTDATRFRCTFLSSFAAPKSIIQVEIKGEVLYVCLENTNYLVTYIEINERGYFYRLTSEKPVALGFRI